MRIRRMVAGVTVAGLVLAASGCGSGAGNKDASSGSAGTGPQAAAPKGPVLVGPTETPETGDEFTSTFALDVDTASYSYARRTLLDGNRPDPRTVRPEEFVNSFRQGYQQPQGSGFAVSVDGGKLSPDVRMLRVGLQTREAALGERRDARLTFVIDTSGSMAGPGRLDLVKESLRTLVAQLRPSDAVAIVAFNGTATTILPMTPIAEKDKLIDAIVRLQPGDSTNLEAGLVLGYKEARKGFVAGLTNRVILASDGLANTGDTESAPILRQVADEARNDISLLCVGVGSDYGDALMEQLADKGDGRALYVSEQDKADRLFVEQLPATVEIRAKDAKAQVKFDPNQVSAYRLLGYTDRKLNSEDFRNDSVDGGEIGPGHAVTALYAVRLKSGAAGHVGDVQVRWTDPDTGKATETGRTITVSDAAPDLWTDGPLRLRIDVAAAYFAEWLKGVGTGHGSSAFVTDGRLAGEPIVPMATLRHEVDQLAGTSEDKDVTDLATLMARAA
jgi:Ca-activated chloride channel family protein